MTGNKKLLEILLNMEKSLKPKGEEPINSLNKLLDKQQKILDLVFKSCTHCFPEEKRLAYQILNIVTYPENFI